MRKLPENILVLNEVDEHTYSYVVLAPFGWPQGEFHLHYKLGKHKREHFKIFQSQENAVKRSFDVLQGE